MEPPLCVLDTRSYSMLYPSTPTRALVPTLANPNFKFPRVLALDLSLVLVFAPGLGTLLESVLLLFLAMVLPRMTLFRRLFTQPRKSPA